MITPYTAPSQNGRAFNCPQCQAFATHAWGYIDHIQSNCSSGFIKGMSQSTCSHCGLIAFWKDGKMVYPLLGGAPPPNPDLPKKIIEDYNEAQHVSSLSPRGAAALLRLCIQNLCIHLGEKGKNINEDIQALVAKGLPVKVQQALDIVCVVRNNAVQPGQLDLRDDPETVAKLFGLVNLIADEMITRPKHIKEMYSAVIPLNQQAAIKTRDNK